MIRKSGSRFSEKIMLKQKLEAAVTDQRRLIALDADDLAVISAHVQDAAVRVGDIIWRQAEKRLVIGMNRLDWDQAISGEMTPSRLVAALRFDRVLSCKSRNIDLEAPETALELLGIEFQSTEPPGGSAVLMFASGGALRLDVECLECELADLGPEDLGTNDLGGGIERSDLEV
jgi:hypothetical protein